jgi:hypothetical protein
MVYAKRLHMEMPLASAKADLHLMRSDFSSPLVEGRFLAADACAV